MSFILFFFRVLSLLCLLVTTFSGYFLIIDWELYNLQRGILTYRIIFDWISCTFLFTVFLISSMVIYYRRSYINHEILKNSFAFIVFLFVISIIFLIIRPRLIRVILGWDGLGLVSYLLVIYYQNYKSYAAGILTCLRNRIGDRAILVSIGWLLSLGRIDFFYYNFLRENLEILIASSFIVLAAITKRAQIPFSSWLPAAMAAPTPVSALVHSSTLVTAGVFLLIRFFPIFSGSGMKSFLFISGALTITISSLGAFYEIDLKKIIALSTLSQLGLMMIALRMNIYLLAFFHLLTHALFKASLFLCAGRIIHLYNGRQDVRNLNIITSFMPFTSACLLICSLSLGGFPFLSAFYSKDKIIEEALSRGYNIFCLILLFISILFTMVYRFRLIYYICIETYDIRIEANKDDRVIVKSIGVLTLGGIAGGRILRWLLFDIDYDNLFRELKIGILFLLILGAFLGLFVKFNKINFLAFYYSSMWFLPAFRTKFISFLGLLYGKTVFKYWDRGWNEVLGPQGLTKELSFLSRSLNYQIPRLIKFILIFRFLLIIVYSFILYFCSLYKA